MQTNEDVGKVAQATPVVVSKALEMFMQSIVDETVRQARDKGSRKLTSQHLYVALSAFYSLRTCNQPLAYDRSWLTLSPYRKRAIHENETFDFLKDIVAGVADATEERSAGDGSTRAIKKRKTASKVEEDDDAQEGPEADDDDDEYDEDEESD